MLKKKSIIALLAITMLSAVVSMATGCKLIDKIEQAKCEHATEVVTEIEPATCTENGLTEGVKCGDCGEWIVKPSEIAKLGHEEIKDEAVPATCLTNGLTEGSHCSRCEEIIKKQETVKATGHKVALLSAVSPTCTETGLTEGYGCEKCGEAYTGREVVSALGHSNDDTGRCSVCTLKVYSTADDPVILEQGHMYRINFDKGLDTNFRGYEAYGSLASPFNVFSTPTVNSGTYNVKDVYVDSCVGTALILKNSNGSYDLTGNFSQCYKGSMEDLCDSSHYLRFKLGDSDEYIYLPVDYINFDDCFEWQFSEDGCSVDLYVKNTAVQYSATYETAEGSITFTGTVTLSLFGDIEDYIVDPTVSK